jgi:hypothetical protein
VLSFDSLSCSQLGDRIEEWRQRGGKKEEEEKEDEQAVSGRKPENDPEQMPGSVEAAPAFCTLRLVWWWLCRRLGVMATRAEWAHVMLAFNKSSGNPASPLLFIHPELAGRNFRATGCTLEHMVLGHSGVRLPRGLPHTSKHGKT